MQATHAGPDARIDAYLDGVRELLAPIKASAPEIEAARQLPPDIAELLRAAGMFGCAVPASWGGLELDPVTISRGIELLATADGSAAWCAMIGCDTGFASAYLEDAAAREVWRDPSRASVFVVNPTGVATVVEGGYNVTGRWTFASGSTHAAVYALGCVVMSEAGPRMLAPSVPAIQIITVQAEQAQVIDTWVTTGVRGSGSHDVAVTGVFVPESHTFPIFPGESRRDGPLYRYPLMFALKLAPVALGIARAAIDDVVGIAATKRTVGGSAPIRDQGWLHTAVANAEIALGQARAYYYEALSELWDEVLSGVPMPSRTAQAKIHAAQIGAVDRCVEVVDAMYKAGGSAALYSRGTLDRKLRDIHTIAQHTAVSVDRLAEAGSVFLGVPGGPSMFIR